MAERLSHEAGVAERRRMNRIAVFRRPCIPAAPCAALLFGAYFGEGLG